MESDNGLEELQSEGHAESIKDNIPGLASTSPSSADRNAADEYSESNTTTASGKNPDTCLPSTTNGSVLAYPLRPIGHVRSCFGGRNGTPRQPLLVHHARASLTLRSSLSPELLDGLQHYSHCWIIFVFHENTDLQRLWRPNSDRGVRAKIRVPRLDGGRLGALATRSPHRPCPIGLSAARIIRIDGRTVLLEGADLVDGTPVLDIKPYVPFCDALTKARAPDWVAAEALAGAETLAIGRVELDETAQASLATAWNLVQSRRKPSARLYDTVDEFLELVKGALARDIRSVTQRQKVPDRHSRGASGALDLAAGEHESMQKETSGFWKVVLDGVEISYDVQQEEEGAPEPPCIVIRGGKEASLQQR